MVGDGWWLMMVTDTEIRSVMISDDETRQVSCKASFFCMEVASLCSKLEAQCRKNEVNVSHRKYTIYFRVSICTTSSSQEFPEMTELWKKQVPDASNCFSHVANGSCLHLQRSLTLLVGLWVLLNCLQIVHQPRSSQHVWYLHILAMVPYWRSRWKTCPKFNEYSWALPSAAVQARSKQRGTCSPYKARQDPNPKVFPVFPIPRHTKYGRYQLWQFIGHCHVGTPKHP